jgi:hypothetical protein
LAKLSGKKKNPQVFLFKKTSKKKKKKQEEQPLSKKPHHHFPLSFKISNYSFCQDLGSSPGV